METPAARATSLMVTVFGSMEHLLVGLIWEILICRGEGLGIRD